MEGTESITEYTRGSVCARGIRGYSATFLQACRKRRDELLGGQSRVAEGTDGFFMGISRRSGAEAMYRSHAETDRLGSVGENVSGETRGAFT